MKTENVSMEDIFEALSDNKALILFNTIALASDVDNESIQIQIRKLGLTTRQYYSRMSRLIETGLIRRLNGRYSLTLLGKMIYDVYITTSRVLSYHWKLLAIESMQMSSPAGAKLPAEEVSKVVDTLIGDHEIKYMVKIALALPLTKSEKYPKQKEEAHTIKVKSRTIWPSHIS
jgi:hypothetical protein